MESSLTPELRAKIEHNRRLALERRAVRLAEISQSKTKVNVPSTSVQSSNVQHKSFLSAPGTQNDIQNSNVKPQIGSPLKSILRSDASNHTTLSSLVVEKLNEKPLNSNSFYQRTSSSLTSSGFKYSSKKLQDNPVPAKTTSQSSGTSNFPSRSQTRTVGDCRLVSKERFTVDIPYQQQAIDVFRTINGKEYDSKTKLWTFPTAEYFNLKKAVNELKPSVIVGDLPKCVIETFITKPKNYLQDITKVDISRIDPKLRDALYPFQKEGIQYGVTRKGRCLIADDMGLGKSIQALGIADYYRDDWPLLIVCPSSMRYQWEEEIRVRLPSSVPTHQVFVMTTGKDIVDGATVLILSYDLLAKRIDLIKEMQFGVVIMDESHSIKSIKTKRGKAALDIAQQCSRVILLSGTPVLSRPVELYNQIKAIDPNAFPYFKDYGMRYCNGVQSKFGWDFSGSSNMEELGILLEQRIMIRRMKSQVLKQLPGKIRQVITLNSQSLNKSNDSMDAFAQKLQSTALKGRERHGCLLQYFSETSKTKAAAVCEYITDVLQDNRKFLCFAHHSEMLDAISETLEKNKTFYIRIDGSVSAEDRKQLCDKFQYEDKWKVAVLSIKAANTGLTLTAAQMVIFAELFWNPGDLAQAEDRVHRIGQEDCVVVKYLIARGTADDYLWPLVQSKLEVLNKAGLSKDSYMDADHKTLMGLPPKEENQTKISGFLSSPQKKGIQTKINSFYSSPQKKETQTNINDSVVSPSKVESVQKIDDFFEDDDLLLSVMDEVDSVVKKKIKLG